MDRLKKLEGGLTEGSISFDCCTATIEAASRDASVIQIPPVCVVRPDSTKQVAETVRLCRSLSLPVSVAGGYTGLSGGVLGYRAVRIEMKLLDSFEVRDGVVRAQAGTSVPEVIRAAESEGVMFPVQPASACRVTDEYEYLGTRVGPVTVGGSLGANASGLVGCRFGTALDWVRELTVVLPSGKIESVTDRFERFVGTEGLYGIITEAVIELCSVPENMQAWLLTGKGSESFSKAAVAIGESGTLPMLAEAMVAGDNPPDLGTIARKIFDDADSFLSEYGDLFDSGSWLVLLQGMPDEVRACVSSLERHEVAFEAAELSERDFMRIKQIRSAASDEIGTGVENTRSGDVDAPPIERAAMFLAEAINIFKKRGISPKAEHNLGLLRVFLWSDEERDAFRSDIESGRAFDDGSLEVYKICDGSLERFFSRFLRPRVTDEMVRTKTAVNFPGNEDILIRADQFVETMELLNGLMKKYGACPVPLYYCHVNFRKQPGRLLVHNRLLIDVKEFR